MDVAGSNPVSRSIFSIASTQSQTKQSKRNGVKRVALTSGELYLIENTSLARDCNPIPGWQSGNAQALTRRLEKNVPDLTFLSC